MRTAERRATDKSPEVWSLQAGPWIVVATQDWDRASLAGIDYQRALQELGDPMDTIAKLPGLYGAPDWVRCGNGAGKVSIVTEDWTAKGWRQVRGIQRQWDR